MMLWSLPLAKVGRSIGGICYGVMWDRRARESDCQPSPGTRYGIAMPHFMTPRAQRSEPSRPFSVTLHPKSRARSTCM